MRNADWRTSRELSMRKRLSPTCRLRCHGFLLHKTRRDLDYVCPKNNPTFRSLSTSYSQILSSTALPQELYAVSKIQQVPWAATSQGAQTQP